MLFNSFVQAMHEIKRNLMRSFLTAIGIVIGIASVIAMVNIGKGASQSITQNISKLGSNVLYIAPGQEHGGPRSSPTFTKAFKMKDVDMLRNSIFSISAITPFEGASLTVLFKEKNYQTSVSGVNNNYLKIHNWSLKSGKDFSESELKSGRNVCILGQTVVNKLFDDTESPVGKKIRLQKFSCEVVGTLSSKGANTFGRDQDDVVLVPIKMFLRRMSGSDNIHLMIASIKPNIPLEEAVLQIKRLMRELRNIKVGTEDNFSIRSMAGLLSVIGKVTSMLTTMLAAVAAISLVVGGIGIMNVMLVSVSERTREIGIRMAVGAMANDIMMQFLIEAVLLSALGGIVGVLFGVGITVLVSNLLDIQLIIDSNIIIISLLFSMLIGIVFGILPARKAAKMNPIDALRHE